MPTSWRSLAKFGEDGRDGWTLCCQFANCFSVGPKSTPGRLKMDLRRPQNGARIVHGRLGAVRNAQDRPKNGPRASQERPKSVQEAPKSSPRGAQETPRRAQDTPRGTNLVSKGSKIESKSSKNRFQNASRCQYRFGHRFSTFFCINSSSANEGEPYKNLVFTVFFQHIQTCTPLSKRIMF